MDYLINLVQTSNSKTEFISINLKQFLAMVEEVEYNETGIWNKILINTLAKNVKF